jgi:hypothetical protein
LLRHLAAGFFQSASKYGKDGLIEFVFAIAVDESSYALFNSAKAYKVKMYKAVVVLP